MDIQSKPLGVIGLGLLGTAIVERFLDHQNLVVGYDVDAIRREHVRTLGGSAATEPGDVFSQCDVILLSLPTSDIVASVVEQVPAAVTSSKTFIDTTTGDPDQMVQLGLLLAGRGAAYVEANVAGSSQQMRNGTATVFLGGEPSVIEDNTGIFAVFAPQRIYLGPVGSASRFKLVHNLILGLNRAVLAEGLYFADSLGFSPAETLSILRETPAASAVMNTKGDKMARREYDLQARLSQHLKDVRLMLQEASRARVHLPLSELHRELLTQADALGFGDADNSAIIEAYYAGQEKRPAPTDHGRTAGQLR